MRVNCPICGDLFESLIIDPELALKELIDKTSKHGNQKHHDRFKVCAEAIQRCVAAVALLLHCGEFMVVPSQEEFVVKRLESARDAVMLAAGFEPESTEDGEETGDELLTEEDGGELGEVMSQNVKTAQKGGSTNVGQLGEQR